MAGLSTPSNSRPNLINRIEKVYRAILVFDGTAGAGLVGAITIARLTGEVFITKMSVHCTTDLVSGGGGTIELGVAGNTASLIAQTTATALDAGEFWQDATPELGVSPAIVDKVVGDDIILTVATGDVTAGKIEFCIYYEPSSFDGYLG